MAARAEDLADLRDRVLAALARRAADAAPAPPEGAVLIADELTPSALPGARLVAARRGGARAAAARPATWRSSPGRAARRWWSASDGLETVASGEPVLLDADAGTSGRVAVAGERAPPSRRGAARPRQRDAAAAEAATRPGRTADGTAVAVLVNVDDPDLLDRLSPAVCDGVGLTRTEFLFERRRAGRGGAARGLPRASSPGPAGRPVTIRTLDAGGDKPMPGHHHRRRGQPVPRGARPAAVAGAARSRSGCSCARWPARPPPGR